MKQKLALIFAILSLGLLLSIEREAVTMHSSMVAQGDQSETLTDENLVTTLSFTQADCSLDLSGRRVQSTTVTWSQTNVKGATSRPNAVNSLHNTKSTLAWLGTERSYTYSCDFPFEHQPQRELFYTLRNIRI